MAALITTWGSRPSFSPQTVLARKAVMADNGSLARESSSGGYPHKRTSMSNPSLDELHHVWTTALADRDWTLLDPLVPILQVICPALLFVPDALGISFLERSVARGPLKALECLALVHAERSHAPDGEFQAMLDGALFAAARSSDDTDLAQALCMAGACVDSASPSNGRPALHDALANGNFNFAEALLILGAADDAPDVDGLLPADHLGIGMGDFSRGSRQAKLRPPMVDAMFRSWLADNNFSDPSLPIGILTPPPLPPGMIGLESISLPEIASEPEFIPESAVVVSLDLFARLTGRRGEQGGSRAPSDAPKS